MTTKDEMAAEHVAHRVTGATKAGACPDGNLLAGFAEHTLDSAETETVAAHASACPTCRTTLADLASAEVGAKGAASRQSPRQASGPGTPAASRARNHRYAFAAAALVLVAAGVGIWARTRELPEAQTTVDPEARLLAVAGDLARAEPRWFAEFTPLSAAERRADAGPSGERGGLRLLAPSDAILDGRPTFRWVAVPGVAKYEVRLAREDGTALATRTANEPALALPDDVELVRGTGYVWTVAVDAVLGGRTEARRSFRYATETEAVEFFDAARAIRARAPPEVRELLVAHFALRRGYVAEAEYAARAHARAFPDDPIGRETLVHVLRRQGVPDAESVAGPAGTR